MEIGKLPMAIVGITIAVIVCAVVMIPVVQESTTAYDTFTNEGYYYLEKVTSENTTYTAKWDHTEPTKFTVDGESFVIMDSSITNQVSIVLGDSFFLRYYPTGDDGPYVGLYYDGVAIVYASVTNSTDMELSYDGTTLTIGNTADTPVSREITVSEFYSIAQTGDYVMKKSNAIAYMNSDSEFYGSGRSNALGTIVGTNVYGTIEEPEIKIWRGAVTPSNIVINDVQNSSHIDLYELSSITFTITNESEESTTLTYSYIVVPAKVIAERSIHPDATTTQLINVIPILVIIGILMLVVGTMIYYRR